MFQPSLRQSIASLAALLQYRLLILFIDYYEPFNRKSSIFSFLYIEILSYFYDFESFSIFSELTFTCSPTDARNVSAFSAILLYIG